MLILGNINKVMYLNKNNYILVSIFFLINNVIMYDCVNCTYIK